jgi:hypothetical protein
MKIRVVPGLVSAPWIFSVAWFNRRRQADVQRTDDGVLMMDENVKARTKRDTNRVFFLTWR